MTDTELREAVEAASLALRVEESLLTSAPGTAGRDFEAHCLSPACAWCGAPDEGVAA